MKLTYIKNYMAHKRKGQLASTKEWAKHLRSYCKRIFWKKERSAEKKMISKVLKED